MVAMTGKVWRKYSKLIRTNRNVRIVLFGGNVTRRWYGPLGSSISWYVHPQVVPVDTHDWGDKYWPLGPHPNTLVSTRDTIRVKLCPYSATEI